MKLQKKLVMTCATTKGYSAIICHVNSFSSHVHLCSHLKNYKHFAGSFNNNQHGILNHRSKQ
jgi:hypothetical protein